MFNKKLKREIENLHTENTKLFQQNQELQQMVVKMQNTDSSCKTGKYCKICQFSKVERQMRTTNYGIISDYVCLFGACSNFKESNRDE